MLGVAERAIRSREVMERAICSRDVVELINDLLATLQVAMVLVTVSALGSALPLHSIGFVRRCARLRPRRHVSRRLERCYLFLLHHD